MIASYLDDGDCIVHKCVTIYDACKKWGQTNERTDGKLNSRSRIYQRWMVGANKNWPLITFLPLSPLQSFPRGCRGRDANMLRDNFLRLINVKSKQSTSRNFWLLLRLTFPFPLPYPLLFTFMPRKLALMISVWSFQLLKIQITTRTLLKKTTSHS